MEQKVLYRFADVNGENGIHVYMSIHTVTKETKASYRIGWPPYHKWVRKGTGKRYAHDNKKDAMHSYLARKDRQIRIYNARLASAQVAKIIALHLNDTLDQVTEFKYYTEFDSFDMPTI